MARRIQTLTSTVVTNTGTDCPIETLYAVCDDGTVWTYQTSCNDKWYQLPSISDAEPSAPDAGKPSYWVITGKVAGEDEDVMYATSNPMTKEDAFMAFIEFMSGWGKKERPVIYCTSAACSESPIVQQVIPRILQPVL